MEAAEGSVNSITVTAKTGETCTKGGPVIELGIFFIIVLLILYILNFINY